MKRYGVAYKLAKSSEEPFLMPSLIYDTKEEAEQVCADFNSVTPFFINSVVEINEN